MKLSIYWMEKSANQGSSSAQRFLYEVYTNNNDGILKDIEKANYWMEVIREREFISNWYYLNVSVAGDHFVLGLRYAYGIGFTKDLEKAQYWLEKGADEDIIYYCNCPEGEENCYCEIENLYLKWKLSDFYAKGEGIPQDMDKAVYWLEKDANLSRANYQYELGKLYLMREYIPNNIEKAKFWLEKAAMREDWCNYGLIRLYLEGEKLPKNPEKAAYWLEKYSNKKDVRWLQYELAECYAMSVDIPDNFEKAVYWMKKAANQGDKKAIIWLIRELLTNKVYFVALLLWIYLDDNQWHLLNFGVSIINHSSL